jgi:hypothetical protein
VIKRFVIHAENSSIGADCPEVDHVAMKRKGVELFFANPYGPISERRRMQVVNLKLNVSGKRGKRVHVFQATGLCK